MNEYKYIDNLILSEIASNHIAGANVLICKDGKKLYSNSYGMADIEKNIKMSEDTIFRMFSMSKMITGACAMILMERGIIDLLDPVYKYIPTFQNQMVWTGHGDNFEPADRPVLIKDLLNMTSGLTYPEINNVVTANVTKLFSDIDAKRKKGIYTSTVEFASEIGKLPLEFQPGTKWRYGTNADVMGAVVEIASGKRFSEFIRDEITIPLHMHDTGFYVPKEKMSRLAQKYRFVASGVNTENALSVTDSVSGRVKQSENLGTLKIEPGTHLAMEGFNHAPQFESGGAGIVSTMDDFRKFGQMLLNDGISEDGQKILGKETVRFYRTNQLPQKVIDSMNWESLDGYGYGNFNRVLLDPTKYQTNAPIGEYGWDGWLGTYITLDQSNNFLFEYGIQLADAGSMGPLRKLRQIAYSFI